MDILHLETEASKLRVKLLKKIPYRNKLFLLYTFFNLLLDEKNNNVIQSYLLEFGAQYFDLISGIEIHGIRPSLLKDVSNQAERVLSVLPEETKRTAVSALETPSIRYKELQAVLAGEDPREDPCACLPLLEDEPEKFHDDYGVLSTLSVQIKPIAAGSKFHIIAGTGESGAEIRKQAEASLHAAVRIAGRYTKIKHKSWDVYIDFENKEGEYTGSSFGVLLVLKLVEEILRFNDSPTRVYTSTAAAFTGAVNEDGSIPSLTKDIISKKTKIVFFSGIKQFVIPEEDFPEARNTLHDLQVEYPERTFKLVGIQSADDIFDLRNLINIRKENVIVRTGRFIRRQALALFLLIPLIAIIIFSGVFDMDNNPDHFEYKGKVGFVMNKSGRKLHETILADDYNNDLVTGIIKRSGKIIDINRDGRNEIVLCNNLQAFRELNLHKNRIVCYDRNLYTRWEFSFDRIVSTSRERHSNIFDPGLVDTITIDDTLNLFCTARNNPNEISAVFRLDCMTGKMMNNVLWHSGHILDALIHRGEKKSEFYADAINNGFGRAVIFSMDLDNMKGQLPAAPDYEFLNIKTADPDQYVLLPKSDLTYYYQSRYNIPLGLYIDKNKDEIFIYVMEGDVGSEYGGLAYRFTMDLEFIAVSFSDALIEKRDALVNAGKIKGPLTRTDEFEQSLVSQLRYWNGSKFVSDAERFDSAETP